LQIDLDEERETAAAIYIDLTGEDEPFVRPPVRDCDSGSASVDELGYSSTSPDWDLALAIENEEDEADRFLNDRFLNIGLLRVPVGADSPPGKETWRENTWAECSADRWARAVDRHTNRWFARDHGTERARELFFDLVEGNAMGLLEVRGRGPYGRGLPLSVQHFAYRRAIRHFYSSVCSVCLEVKPEEQVRCFNVACAPRCVAETWGTCGGCLAERNAAFDQLMRSILDSAGRGSSHLPFDRAMRRGRYAYMWETVVQLRECRGWCMRCLPRYEKALVELVMFFVQGRGQGPQPVPDLATTLAGLPSVLETVETVKAIRSTCCESR
jgi:hypothetical protein